MLFAERDYDAALPSPDGALDTSAVVAAASAATGMSAARTTAAGAAPAAEAAPMGGSALSAARGAAGAPGRSVRLGMGIGDCMLAGSNPAGNAAKLGMAGIPPGNDTSGGIPCGGIPGIVVIGGRFMGGMPGMLIVFVEGIVKEATPPGEVTPANGIPPGAAELGVTALFIGGTTGIVVLPVVSGSGAGAELFSVRLFMPVLNGTSEKPSPVGAVFEGCGGAGMCDVISAGGGCVCTGMRCR